MNIYLQDILRWMRDTRFMGTHPDSTRQRKARQRSKDYRRARELKRQYVPLYFVAKEAAYARTSRYVD